MKKDTLYVITAGISAFLGWIITEPWDDDFGVFRSFFITMLVGLFIVLSLVSFNYFYYKKTQLLKQNLKYKLVYILPIVGSIVSEIVYSILYGTLLDRMIAWGVFLGLAINIYGKKKERILIGTVGGLLGGWVAGFLFDIVANIFNGIVARAIGFVLVGVSLAVSLIIVESLYTKLKNNNQFDFDKFKNKKI